ncbi:hypothetical protein [Flammeovirga sp. SJP92]|uniref:hypothetical protein n=1 Tax=Flammeovirga sp. SJP92 TaxID=1775430 RepID=UPI0007878582|nr:hypothetical protein [Flammeovirga sp. SJP92]KXX68774.1 hypothetical protein AVL50_18220 [Flammeovirga sp. SJP92]
MSDQPLFQKKAYDIENHKVKTPLQQHTDSNIYANNPINRNPYFYKEFEESIFNRIIIGSGIFAVASFLFFLISGLFSFSIGAFIIISICNFIFQPKLNSKKAIFQVRDQTLIISDGRNKEIFPKDKIKKIYHEKEVYHWSPIKRDDNSNKYRIVHYPIFILDKDENVNRIAPFYEFKNKRVVKDLIESLVFNLELEKTINKESLELPKNKFKAEVKSKTL